MRKIQIEVEIEDEDIYNYIYVNKEDKEKLLKIISYGSMMYKMESKMKKEENKIMDKDEIIRTLSNRMGELKMNNGIQELKEKLIKMEVILENKDKNINMIIIEKLSELMNEIKMKDNNKILNEIKEYMKEKDNMNIKEITNKLTELRNSVDKNNNEKIGEVQRMIEVLNQMRNEKSVENIRTMLMEMNRNMTKTYGSSSTINIETNLRLIEEKIDNINLRNEENKGSQYKGKEGENKVYEYLNENPLPKMEILNISNKANNGDILVKYKNYKIMLEIKNYKNAINNNEVEKYKRDTEMNDYDGSILISLNKATINNHRIYETEMNKRNQVLMYIPCMDNNYNLIKIGIEHIIDIIKTHKYYNNKNKIDIELKRLIENRNENIKELQEINSDILSLEKERKHIIKSITKMEEIIKNLKIKMIKIIEKMSNELKNNKEINNNKQIEKKIIEEKEEREEMMEEKVLNLQLMSLSNLTKDEIYSRYNKEVNFKSKNISKVTMINKVKKYLNNTQ